MSNLSQFLARKEGSVPVGGAILAPFTSPDYLDSFGGRWLRTGFSVDLVPAAVTALSPFGPVTQTPFRLGAIPTSVTLSVAWNGTVFCAVGVAGQSTATAATSPDGLTWTSRTLPANTPWRAIAWNGSVFCAVSESGNIAATSPDGLTWTQRTLTSSWGGVHSLTWNGSVFCGLTAGTNAGATSPDGITWTQRTLPSTNTWSNPAWNGAVFCSVAQNTAVAITSPDGITWTTRTLPVSSGWRSIAWNGTVFCAVSLTSGVAATSPDGVTWTQRTVPLSGLSVIGVKGSMFLAANGNLAATSTDGITWTQRTLAVNTGTFSANCVGSNSAVFCLLGQSNTTYSSATSPDGTTNQTMVFSTAGVVGEFNQFVRYG